MPYLTPNGGDGTFLCRRLRFPAEFAHIVSGALIRLQFPSAWEAHGDLTVDQCAAAMRDMVDYYSTAGDNCMIGTIVVFATTMPPEGVLLCDGAIYNRVDYPILYAAIDATYILSADTFRVPDLRGRAVIGTGQGPGLSNRVLDASGGAETHTLSQLEMPAHVHAITEPTPGLAVAPGELPVDTPIPVPGATGSAGSGAAHENMQPWRALRCGIVAT